MQRRRWCGRRGSDCQQPPEAGRSKGQILPGASGRSVGFVKSWFQLRDADFWTSDPQTLEEEISVVLSPQVCGDYHSSHRKLTGALSAGAWHRWRGQDRGECMLGKVGTSEKLRYQVGKEKTHFSLLLWTGSYSRIKFEPNKVSTQKIFKISPNINDGRWIWAHTVLFVLPPKNYL